MLSSGFDAMIMMASQSDLENVPSLSLFERVCKGLGLILL
jgi:hypothetical protein